MREKEANERGKKAGVSEARSRQKNIQRHRASNGKKHKAARRTGKNASNGIRFGEAERPGPKKWVKVVPPETKNSRGKRGKKAPGGKNASERKGKKDPEPQCQWCELEECHLPRHRHPVKPRGQKNSGKPKNHALLRIARNKTSICKDAECEDLHLHCVDTAVCRQPCCAIESKDDIGTFVSPCESEDEIDNRYEEMAVDLGFTKQDFAEMHSGPATEIKESPPAALSPQQFVRTSVNSPSSYAAVLGQRAIAYRNEAQQIKLHGLKSHGPPLYRKGAGLWATSDQDLVYRNSIRKMYSYSEFAYESTFNLESWSTGIPPVAAAIQLPDLNFPTPLRTPPPLEQEPDDSSDDSESSESDEETDDDEKHAGKEPESKGEDVEDSEDSKSLFVDRPFLEALISHAGLLWDHSIFLRSEKESPSSPQPPQPLDKPECVTFRQSTYVLVPDSTTFVPPHILELKQEVFTPDFPEDPAPISTSDPELPKTLKEVMVYTFGRPHEVSIIGKLREALRSAAPYVGGSLNTTTRDAKRVSGTGGIAFPWVSKKIWFNERNVDVDFYLTLGLETCSKRVIFHEMALQLMAASKSMPKPSTLNDGHLVVNGQYTNSLDFYIRKKYVSFFNWMETQGNRIPMLREAYEWTLCYLTTEMAVNHLRRSASQPHGLRHVQHIAVGAPKGQVQELGMVKTYTNPRPTLDAYRDNNAFEKVGLFTPEGLLDVKGIMAALPKGLKYPATYTSRNGGAVHSALVPTKTITQCMCALTRLTNAVEPAKLGFHETMLINGYSYWNTIDFERWFDLPRCAEALAEVPVDMGELYEEATYHPVKGKEYTLCWQQNLDNGLLHVDTEADGRPLENTGKQKVEKMKANSEARLYVTLGPKSAMVGSKATKVLKQTRADKPLLIVSDDGTSVGAIYFMDKPSRATLREWSYFCRYGCDYDTTLSGGNPLARFAGDDKVTHRYIIFNHSDDMYMMLEKATPGTRWATKRLFFTADISKCDKSHGAVFDHYYRFWGGRYDLYDILEAQLMRQIRVDVNGKKVKAWLKPKNPVLLSGHSFTTHINTFTTDVLGLTFILDKCGEPESFIAAAYKAGYKIKCAATESWLKTDFLKHAPGHTSDGACTAVPMLGNFLRFYNMRIGDVPGEGSADLLWLLYNYNNLKSFAHGIESPWISVMLKRMETWIGKQKTGRYHAAVLRQGEGRTTRSDNILMSKQARTSTAITQGLALARRNVKKIQEEVSAKWTYRRFEDEKVQEIEVVDDSAWVMRYVDEQHDLASLLHTLHTFSKLKPGEYYRDDNTDHILSVDYSLSSPDSWCTESPVPDTMY